MSIENKIQLIENKWLSPLTEECKRIFKNHHIPSHDHEHSKRVWTNAKLLLRSIDESGYKLNEQSIGSIIIACFFHDTGLSSTIGEQHGKASREFCNNFFKLYPHLIPENLTEILDIIEYHEDKDYFNTPKNHFSLNSILAVSDDSDAFGYIGVYRYAEIYLMRNIQPQDLANKVLINLENRFNNIKLQFYSLSHFFRQIEKKYDITRTFYSHLLGFYLNNSHNYSAEIIQIIKFEIITNKKCPNEVWLEALKTVANQESIEFLNKLMQEINGN
jgi:hypothetical protein